MVDQDKYQQVEIRDGDHAVAFADIVTPAETSQPVRASLRAESGHIPPGTRARLVDAVLDLPDVQDNQFVLATMPIGDTESLHRLQERCEELTSTSAGSTALIEGHLPRRPAVEKPEDQL